MFLVLLAQSSCLQLAQVFAFKSIGNITYQAKRKFSLIYQNYPTLLSLPTFYFNKMKFIDFNVKFSTKPFIQGRMNTLDIEKSQFQFFNDEVVKIESKNYQQSIIQTHMCNVTIYKSNFVFCGDLDLFGVLEIEASDFKATLCQFHMNFPDRGVLYMNGSVASVTQCNFTSNIAASFGGAIHSSYSTIHSQRCFYMYNHAELSGGCILTEYSNLESLMDLFLFNSAGRSDSVICSSMDTSDLIRRSSFLFNDCEGLQQGVTVFFDCPNVIFEATRFVGNTRQSGLIPDASIMLRGKTSAYLRFCAFDCPINMSVLLEADYDHQPMFNQTFCRVANHIPRSVRSILESSEDYLKKYQMDFSKIKSEKYLIAMGIAIPLLLLVTYVSILILVEK